MARASLLAPFFCAMPWRKKYLENETPEQREERLAYLREYDKQYAAKMTPEQREARLAAKREAERRRFARMTPEQRELHWSVARPCRARPWSRLYAFLRGGPSLPDSVGAMTDHPRRRLQRRSTREGRELRPQNRQRPERGGRVEPVRSRQLGRVPAVRDWGSPKGRRHRQARANQARAGR